MGRASTCSRMAASIKESSSKAVSRVKASSLLPKAISLTKAHFSTTTSKATAKCPSSNRTPAKSESTKATLRTVNYKATTAKFNTFNRRPNMWAVSMTARRAGMESIIMVMEGFGKVNGNIIGRMGMES